MLFIGYAFRRCSPKWLLMAILVVVTTNQALSITGNLARDHGLSGPPNVSLEEVNTRIERSVLKKIHDLKKARCGSGTTFV
jgi:hypothetical protein